MSVLTASPTLGDVLKHELNANVQREIVTIKQSAALTLGTVLGQLTQDTVTATAGESNTGDGTFAATPTLGAQAAVGAYLLTLTGPGPGVAATGTSAAGTGNTGDGTITASPVTGVGAKVGVYRLTCIEPTTNVGTFVVEDPDGITIGIATVAVAFTTHLTCTIADGSTDFVAGDAFTITVAAANSGTFSLRTPSGLFLPAGTVAVAYASLHLNFTLADGSTDFAVDDAFTITVAGSGKYVAAPDTAVDGSAVAAGVLLVAADASAGDVTDAVVLVRGQAIVADAAWSTPPRSTPPPRRRSRKTSLPPVASSLAPPSDPSPAIQERFHVCDHQPLRYGGLFPRRDDRGHQHPAQCLHSPR